MATKTGVVKKSMAFSSTSNKNNYKKDTTTSSRKEKNHYVDQSINMKIKFWSLAEEEDEEEDENNNNVVPTNKPKPTVAEKRITRKQEIQKEINGKDRTTENIFSAVTIETVVNGDKQISEVKTRKHRAVTSDDIEVTTTERTSRHRNRHAVKDDEEIEEKPERNITRNGIETATTERRSLRRNKIAKIENENDTKDVVDEVTTPERRTRRNRFAKDDENERIENGGEPRSLKTGVDSSTTERASRRNRVSKTENDIKEGTQTTEITRVSREKENRKSPELTGKTENLSKRGTRIEDEIASKIKSNEFEKVSEKNNKHLRNRFETTTSDGIGDTRNIRNRFERRSLNKKPASVGDAKSKFENKINGKNDSISQNKQNTDSVSQRINGRNKSPELVKEDIVSVEESVVVESVNIKILETESTNDEVTNNKTVEKIETKHSGSNFNRSGSGRFENKHNTTQSMADFKSKFENKSPSTQTPPNIIPKKPVSMNIRTKFESASDKSNGSKKDNEVPIKPKMSTPPVTAPKPRNQTLIATLNDDNKKYVDKKYVKTIPEHKVVFDNDSNNSIDEFVKNERPKKSAKTTQENGKIKQQQEIVEMTETVEEFSSNPNKKHFEKITTVKNFKIQDDGTVSVTKSESKIELKTELKKTTTAAKDKPKGSSVEERMRERKKKQEAAKKEKAASASKGRNAFKLKLEANKPANITVGMQPQKAPTGNGNIDKLLSWIAKRVNKYPEVNVTNYTTSWMDGIALCVLMHYFLGDEKINLAEVTVENKRKNFEMAIGAATEAGVPALLDAGELVACEEMDRRSMITYLHTIYKVLFADKQDQK